MGIQVHGEIFRHRAVVSTNCIRCLACKSACPNGMLNYRWGLNVISITHRIKWMISQQYNYNWCYEFLLVFCGLIAAYYTQKWLGSFQTFLEAAWGLCFGILIIKFLESRRVSLLEIIQQKRRFLTVVLITLSTLVWCWTTSIPYDIRLLLRGNRFFDLIMKYDQVISVYKQALIEFPSNNEIRAALALAYKMKGDYPNAIMV